jgi:hypothetical protein
MYILVGETPENLDSAGRSCLVWADFFAEDADFSYIVGGHFNCRTTMGRDHRTIVDTIYKGSTNKFRVNKMRFLSSDVALVFLLAELKVVREGLRPGAARVSDSARQTNGRPVEDRRLSEHDG